MFKRLQACAWLVLVLCMGLASCVPDVEEEHTTVSAEEAALLPFPEPEFTATEYYFPHTTEPAPESQLEEWLDVGILFAALSMATYLATFKRSRRGIFFLMLFSLAYFGFYKEGCICPIGSIQNVAASIFNPKAPIPAGTALIFLLPLIFAIFFGRVFCSSVCALGAIQDVMLIKPIKVPKTLGLMLGLIPYGYLSVGVLLAATGTGFVICRYDPFIPFFRLNGNSPYLMLGAGFLMVSTVVGRPYCRFVCPYNILLGWMSRFAKWHLSITPTTCVQCRLCEDSCPFDHINNPTEGLDREERSTGVKRLGKLVAALPILIGLGGYIGYKASIPLSHYNNTVQKAEQLVIDFVQTRDGTAPEKQPGLSATQEFRTLSNQEKRALAHAQMGQADLELAEAAKIVREDMKLGGILVGMFLGLILGAKLLRMSISRTQTDYEVDKPTCYSCARCCPTCPSDALHEPNFVQVDLSNVATLQKDGTLVGAKQA